MSHDDADGFLQKLEQDDDFAQSIKEVSGNPDATLTRAHDAGFDFTPDEMMDALGDRYGIELTPEQLDAIAAGGDAEIVAGVVGGTLLVGALAGAAAVAAVI